MDERVQFIADFLAGTMAMSALCTRYNVSRPTGYKWVARYEADGPGGLEDRSRRPHTTPRACARSIVDEVLRCRRRHPDWGARTIVARLRRQAPDRVWPAPSTAGVWLKRAGLLTPRRRRPRLAAASHALSAMTHPNAVWTIDFKGQFRTRDGAWCYPLTLMDGCTRYLLACQGLAHPRRDATWEVLATAFREFGLPERIRSDNGPPFASPCALARLSPLAVRWIKLGIMPERIQPGRPDENGRHERMHRTLKHATARPPAGSRAAQQRRFNQFRTEYNEERPHAALGSLPPMLLYAPSPRPWNGAVPEVTYPAHFDQRRVTGSGTMKWRTRVVSVSEVLRGESVGLEEIADGEWALYFGPVRLGTYDEQLGRVRPLGQLRDGRSPAVPARADDPPK